MLSKRPSLKRSLTLTLIGCLSALWCTAIYLTLRDARHEVDELFDAQLAQLARGTLAQIVSGQATYSFAQNMLDSEHREPGHLYEQKINFQISRKGEVLSKSTKDLLLPPDIKPGFSNIEIGQQEWRLFHLADKINEVEVTTLQSVDIRNEPNVFPTPICKNQSQTKASTPVW